MIAELYKKYLKEREDAEVIEHPEGFLIYSMRAHPFNHLYISDYYVLPEHRKNGLGYKMANEAFTIAKERNVSHVFCQCDESSNGYDLARHTIENFGFKPYERDGDIHHFIMGVEKWARQ